MTMPTFTIKVNVLEAGALMGAIENLDLPARQVLAGVRQQLISIQKDIEKAAGAVKTLLPDGRLEIKDQDGHRFVRPPCSWEIGGNQHQGERVMR